MHFFISFLVTLLPENVHTTFVQLEEYPHSLLLLWSLFWMASFTLLHRSISDSFGFWTRQTVVKGSAFFWWESLAIYIELEAGGGKLEGALEGAEGRWIQRQTFLERARTQSARRLFRCSRTVRKPSGTDYKLKWCVHLRSWFHVQCDERL